MSHSVTSRIQVASAACRRLIRPEADIYNEYHGPFQAASGAAQSIGLGPSRVERVNDRPRVHGHNVGGEHQQIFVSSVGPSLRYAEPGTLGADTSSHP
jgi:hypothetical protein